MLEQKDNLLPQLLHRLALNAGDLDLAHPQDAGGPLLGHAPVVAQEDHPPLPLRQSGDGGAEGLPLHDALLHAIVPQDALQGEAVPRLALEGGHRQAGLLRGGDLLRLQAGLGGQLGQGGLPAQGGGQPLPGRAYRSRPLLQAPAHLHRPVVPEEAADLPGDLGHGVGGELAAEGGVKAPHRLEKAQAAQLVQVLRLRPPAVIAAHHAPDEPRVLLHQPGAGLVVPPAGLLQQAGDVRHAHTTVPARRESFRRRVTTVPFPGLERTFTASMKLSMMVKPMPLRWASPVVNMGRRASSTSAMPTPQSFTWISRLLSSKSRRRMDTLPRQSG